MASDSPDVYLRFADKTGTKPAELGPKKLIGECEDERHLGSDGWIQIKEFSFSFGAGDSTTTNSHTGKAKDASRMSEGELRQAFNQMTKQAEEEKKVREKEKEKEKEKGGKAWGESGPLKFDMFEFTKRCDRLSSTLMEICHGGSDKIPRVIPRVIVEAVRYGGTGADYKIPFVKLIFENVRIRKVKLNLSNAELPSEDVEFEYDVVTLESIWTDNATGSRNNDQPIRAGWDLPKAVESALSGTSS